MPNLHCSLSKAAFVSSGSIAFSNYSKHFQLF